ncbi:nitroreductase family protein [Streptomyces sp. NBC_00490]|uniref:Acg family FMN-binding oxidoreductase n=1 Tax=Streptomyces sp. NBC_00490 TaxID=2903657 RepID=UPI002E174552
MPTRPDDRTYATALVTAATAAPSLHNAQPWRFRYLRADHALELRADLGRAMPRTDPDHRALHLGCGAALFNLRVAAAHAGERAETSLLPDPADPLLLATVRLAGTDRPDRDLALLFPAVARRHTSRHPFQDETIPADIRDALCDAAEGEGARLLFPEPWHVESLLDHVRDVEGRDTLDPERFEDIRQWTRTGAEAAVDGIPQGAFGPRRRAGRAPVRDFAGRRTVPGRPAADFESAPQLALLGTTHDRPEDWMRAGQALERVLLLATHHGLATSLTSHSLERHDLRELARDPGSAMGFVQMVLRLGYGPSGSETPRRAVSQVLEIV